MIEEYFFEEFEFKEKEWRRSILKARIYRFLMQYNRVVDTDFIATSFVFI